MRQHLQVRNRGRGGGCALVVYATSISPLSPPRSDLVRLVLSAKLESAAEEGVELLPFSNVPRNTWHIYIYIYIYIIIKLVDCSSFYARLLAL